MSKRSRVFMIFMLLSVISLASYQLSSHEREYEPRYEKIEGEIFSTHFKIVFKRDHSLEIDTEEIKNAIMEELNRIDWVASSWKKESELNRYNRAENKSSLKLSKDLAYLIERSIEIEHLTDGAFSITHQRGSIDLSAIAKGYAVDRIAEYLTDQLNLESYLIDIGGEIKAKGVNPKSETWRVGIFIPKGYESSDAPQVILEDTSIATSGRYFKGDHITNPATGESVSNSLISVSVISHSNATADALATALYVMGHKRGLQWANENKVRALFILEDGTVLESML